MSDPLRNALPPSFNAIMALTEKRIAVAELAHAAAQSLADLGYPRSDIVLVQRGSKLEEDTGWCLGYFGSGEPHLRNLYLMVDGTLAIEAIGKHKKHMNNPNCASIKVNQHKYPDLVPFDVNETKGIAECQAIALDIASHLLIEHAHTDDTKRLYFSITPHRK